MCYTTNQTVNAKPSLLKSTIFSTFFGLLMVGNVSAETAEEIALKIETVEVKLEKTIKRKAKLRNKLEALRAALIAEQTIEPVIVEEAPVVEESVVEEAVIEETVIEAVVETEINACSEQSSSEYTLTWDFDDSLDLTGYKVYYGTSSNLNKENAMGEFSQQGNANTTTFVPAQLNLTTCETVYVAIAALGDKPESALSDVMEIVID